MNAMKYFVLSILTFALPVFAQPFPSGSTGSDGALSFTTPGTYTFDPKSYTPALNPANDGVFNFTTINIAAGVTVKLIGSIINSPVVWLAQGAVKIDGTIDLSGQDSFTASNTTQRTYTIPGAGGYSGGYPAIGSNPAGAGSGPAGGAVGGSPCAPGSYPAPGGFSGNQFLVPVVGGSGGGAYGGTAGGAGGGAILIASSVSISGAGSIKATGGASTPGTVAGGGAGGAIRLVSPTVTLSGALNVAPGGNQYCQPGGTGVVRVEAFQIGALNVQGTLYTATPFGLFISPTGIPAVTVVSVGGSPVTPTPTGTFIIPDVTVNSNGPLAVAIQAANVPIGTIVTLVIFSENGPDQTILSTPLAGTSASTTATATVTLPSGFSKGFVKATF